MVKVKANLAIRDAGSADDRADRVGNNEADMAAKLGRDYHPQPATAEWNLAVARHQSLVDLAKAAGKLLPLWPSARTQFGDTLVWMGRPGGRAPRRW